MIRRFHDEIYNRLSYLLSIKKANIYDYHIYELNFLIIDEYISFVEFLDKKRK